MGPQRSPLSRIVVVVVVVVDIDAQAACDATVATPGEWAQHFSNASCLHLWIKSVDGK